MALSEADGGAARREFSVFLLVGLTCAALNFGVGALVRFLAPIGAEWPSVAAGFVAGTVLSFVLNRRFTFAVHDRDVGPQAVRFAVMSLVAIVLSAVVSATLEGLLRVAPIVPAQSALAGNLVHIGTIGLLFVFNFLAMKYFALAREAR